jgi:hypothetical protein
MIDVFINYSAEDRPMAGVIRDVLSEAGLVTWQDQLLTPGDDFVSVINRALEEAGCVVTLWTPNSVRSNWVIAEAKIALRRGTLLPVAAGIAVEDIPSPFNSVQAFLSPINTVALINAVRKLLAARQNTRQLDEVVPRPTMPASELEKEKPAYHHQAQETIKKAFVSYAAEDEEIAVELVNHLERMGCPCWIAFRDAHPGEDYRASIVTAIKEVRFLVLVYSAHVNTSFDIATELLLVRRRNKTRFVIKIDASEPDGPVEYELATVQWVDGQKDRTQAFEKIAQRARLF